MRIIGEIPHPVYKISVFFASDRISIKFEDGLLEQIYKFRDGEGVHNLESAIHFVSDSFLKEVAHHFQLMKKAKYQNLQASGDINEDEFPDII
jgi:hypothetical protein